VHFADERAVDVLVGVPSCSAVCEFMRLHVYSHFVVGLVESVSFQDVEQWHMSVEGATQLERAAPEVLEERIRHVPPPTAKRTPRLPP